MKRTVHSGSESSGWGKSKLASFDPSQAKPNMNKPDTTGRADGKVGGNAPLLSTMAKSKTTRKPV